jgi:hypothetical protein
MRTFFKVWFIQDFVLFRFSLDRFYCSLETCLQRNTEHINTLLHTHKEMESFRYVICIFTPTRKWNHSDMCFVSHPQGNGIIQIHVCMWFLYFRCKHSFFVFCFFFRIKLAKLENIFITHKSWDNIGGLYGK